MSETNELPYLKLTEKEFNDLAEYSASIPTGTTIGKRWKRLHQYLEDGQKRERWYIGEYAVDPDPKFVKINWYRPLVEKGGMYV